MTERMKKWPLSDDPLSWPIERWKDLFDSINDDCTSIDNDEIAIPYSDLGFYADQIYNICSGCGQTIDQYDAELKAQQLLRMEIADMCAILVMQNNKENWCEGEECSFANFGTAPETAEMVLQGLFEEVAEVVAKKQKTVDPKTIK